MEASMYDDLVLPTGEVPFYQPGIFGDTSRPPPPEVTVSSDEGKRNKTRKTRKKNVKTRRNHVQTRKKHVKPT